MEYDTRQHIDRHNSRISLPVKITPHVDIKENYSFKSSAQYLRHGSPNKKFGIHLVAPLIRFHISYNFYIKNTISAADFALE